MSCHKRTIISESESESEHTNRKTFFLIVSTWFSFNDDDMARLRSIKLVRGESGWSSFSESVKGIADWLLRIVDVV